MSVTLKLSDEDAKLIGDVLGVVSSAAIKARGITLSAGEDSGIAPAGVAEATLRGKRAMAFGSQVLANSRMTSFSTADNLQRIGAAFDTAVYANESKR